MKKYKIAVIGLGYVGLPLAHAFAKKGYNVFGFDISNQRIADLNNFIDKTLELDRSELIEIKNNIVYCDNLQNISDCNIYIITVPTPIDKYNKPDLSPLINTSQSVGSILSKDDIVIYESTVYPGVTEEVCIPELEKFSKMKFNQIFLLVIHQKD